MAFHYAWSFAFRELVRSGRWSAREKVGAVLTYGMLTAAALLGAELFWILTGRGRTLRRIYGGGYVVVVATGNRKVGARLVEQALAEAQPSATASARDAS